MEPTASNLCMSTDDSDNESSFNNSLLNELPSISDDDNVEDQRHVDDTVHNDPTPVSAVSPTAEIYNIPNLQDGEGITPQSKVQNLRSYLQNQCYDGCKWTSKLMFQGSMDKNTFQEMNVLQYIGDPQYKDKNNKTAYRVYFDPSKYPVTDEFAKITSLPDNASLKEQTQNRFKSTSYIRLSKDLREACGNCAFNIVQNGNQKLCLKNSGLTIRNRFSCQKYMIHKGGVRDLIGNKDFRRYTYRNDRKNQRELGRKKCRRSYSGRSLTSQTRCKFFFYINFDSYGFYVEPGYGNKFHSHHFPLNKAKGISNKGDLDSEESELISDMADGQAPDAQIQNVLFNKTGKLVARSTIRHITKYHKRFIVNDSDFEDMFHGKKKGELSATEHMMTYCRSKNYNFQLLLNDPLMSSDPTSETYMNNQEEPTTESILDFNQREMDSLRNNINFGRIAMSLNDNQKYMMAFAWINPKELFILEAFPEVIMVDTTEKTNNEKRPLLTAGGKDSNGNMFIFLRVFMPNQQSWMFRWVFSVVFPRLIPKHILQNVKIVITDGDPQEFLQVDNAIENVIPNAKRVRCGWHLVHQGFDRYVDTTFPDICSTVIDNHKKIIQNWMYSWMKGRCSSYLQYKYSRYLFMKYLYSREIIDTFGVSFSNNVAMFLRKHVLPHEKTFLYCLRNNIRHYGEYSNTPLEGTNFGLKHSSIATHPGLSMDNSMKILSQLSEKHVKKVNSTVIRQNKKHCVNYKEEVHDKMTIRGSSMLANTISVIDRYDCIRIEQNLWKVKKKNRTNNNNSNFCTPDFDVLNTVHILDTSIDNVKQLGCSCTYTSVYGLPCVHTLVVATTMKPHWKYVNHNDVSVRWLKSYYLYSLPEKIIPDQNRQKQTKQAFQSLRKHEVVGIHVKIEWYKQIPIVESPLPLEYLEQEHVIRCANYPDSNEVNDFDPFLSTLDSTLSQVTEIGTEMEDENDNAVLQFVSDNVTATITQTNKENSFFSQLKPNFSEAVNWITSQDDVDRMKRMFDNFISEMKQLHSVTHPVSESQEYVSSNMPIETSKKHHGCMGYTQKKKRKR